MDTEILLARSELATRTLHLHLHSTIADRFHNYTHYQYLHPGLPFVPCPLFHTLNTWVLLLQNVIAGLALRIKNPGSRVRHYKKCLQQTQARFKIP
jgi:hypothetical protein